jgi:hypothetical protein
MLKLRAVENDLYSPLAAELTSLFDKEISSTHGFKSKTYGQVPRLLGKALGINEHHGDIRKESKGTPLSRHLSGMAIDINYTTNPWIKDAKGLSLINKALTAAKKPAISIKGIATIQQCFDVGINHLDTAYVYGPKGESENLIRRALGNRRDEMVIATKCGIHYEADEMVTDNRPERLRIEIDESLQRLGTDHVELLYLHAPDEVVPLSESAGALREHNPAYVPGHARRGSCRANHHRRAASQRNAPQRLIGIRKKCE